MLLKQKALLSCNAFQSLSRFTTSSTEPSNNPSCHHRHHQTRSYAVFNEGKSRHVDYRWPEITGTNKVPNPYQIFNQQKGSKYSKERFYTLVKIYHPDRHDQVMNDGLDYATKLERYRLVVAANDILSDPIKRNAYDTWGAGWNSSNEAGMPHGMARTSTKYGTYTQRGWNPKPGAPMRNATWEDWERWHQKEAGGPQQETFSSNSVFVSLIMMFAAIGFVGQVTRVESHTETVMEHRGALHISVSEDLRRRRQGTAAIEANRDERIRSFLNSRGPDGYGVTGLENTDDVKLLPAPPGYSSTGSKDLSSRG
ncbi:hypothetical protein BJ878DRAFT_254779 [Calycina marina]|uniref:J domain-containing protein n=1 Tax=Calycina marina TaxID=1763456 RepID=A0A9P8CD76_9HELO|nr:hypothetical protein BJ878DRAFT_254779 [Calycina marina]